MNDQEMMLYALSHGWRISSVDHGWVWFSPNGSQYLVRDTEVEPHTDLPILDETARVAMLRYYNLRRPAP